MTRLEHLLLCLSEECAEVAQRVSKAMRFGLTEVEPGQAATNAERIEAELLDLIAAAEMLAKAGAFGALDNRDAIDRKKEKVERYLAYSAECGTLQSDNLCPLSFPHEPRDCCDGTPWPHLGKH